MFDLRRSLPALTLFLFMILGHLPQANSSGLLLRGHAEPPLSVRDGLGQERGPDRLDLGGAGAKERLHRRRTPTSSQSSSPMERGQRHDLTSIRISDDGEVLVFVRGHTPNSQGWVANPNSDPMGAERAIWAVGTRGGKAWRVAEGSDPALSPDGRWVLFVKDGQIYRAPVNTGTALTETKRRPPAPLPGLGPEREPVLVPRWPVHRLREPDGTDHSFIGDVRHRASLGPVYGSRGGQGHPTHLVPRRDSHRLPTAAGPSVRGPGSSDPRRSRRDSHSARTGAGSIRRRVQPTPSGSPIWRPGKGTEIWHNPARRARTSTNISDLMWADDHLVFHVRARELATLLVGSGVRP